MHRHQQNSNDADEQRQPLVVSNQSIHRASYGAIDDDVILFPLACFFLFLNARIIDMDTHLNKY